MSGLDLEAIQARAEAATAGPWLVDGDDPAVVMKPDRPPSTWDGLLVARVRGSDGADIDSLPEYADAEFIAAARTDVPALVAELSRMRQKNSELHSRAQSAEAAARQTVESVRNAGRSFGLSLANWAANDYHQKLQAVATLHSVDEGCVQERMRPEWTARCSHCREIYPCSTIVAVRGDAS